MRSERIIRIGRLVYADLIEQEVDDYFFLQDKKGQYDCEKIFWRFYWAHVYSY